MLSTITILSLATPLLATVANIQGFNIPVSTGSKSCDVLAVQLAQYYSKGVKTGSVSLDAAALYQCLVSVPDVNTLCKNTTALPKPGQARPTGNYGGLLSPSKGCTCPPGTASTRSASSTTRSASSASSTSRPTSSSRSTTSTSRTSSSTTRASAGLPTPSRSANFSSTPTTTRPGTVFNTPSSTPSSSLVTFKGAGSIMTPTNLLGSLSIIVAVALLG